MVYECLGAKPGDWAGKTCSEIAAIGEQPGSILVIPVGSVEQHGEHLPTATDTILVDAVTDLGIERVVDEIPILRTPPVWSGYSPHHLSFGGTVTLEFDVLMDILENIADSALENGFDALVLVNGHGGNGPLVSGAVSTIGDAHPDVEVLGLTYFELMAGLIDDIRESEIGGMAHGGEFETSLMLHFRPDLVGDDREARPLEEPYDLGTKDLLESGPLSVYRRFEEYSDSGAIGAPELATAKKGSRLAELLGAELESLFVDIQERNA